MVPSFRCTKVTPSWAVWFPGRSHKWNVNKSEDKGRWRVWHERLSSSFFLLGDWKQRRHHYIYYTRVNVNNLGAISWRHIPGRLKDVSSGAVFRYGVNAHNHIWCASLTGQNWCRLSGAPKQISAHGRKVVGVNRDGMCGNTLGTVVGDTSVLFGASMGRDGEFWVM